MEVNKCLKKQVLIVILVYLILLSFFPVTSKTTVTLMAQGNKNDLSKGEEVWLVGIELDGKKSDLNDYQVAGKWTHKNSSIVYIPNTSEKNDNLVLQFSNASDISLIFNKHEWSGLVGIEDGSKYTELDLYDLSGEIEYKVENNIPFRYPISKVFISVILIIFFAYYVQKIAVSLRNSEKIKNGNSLLCCSLFLALTFLLRTFSIKYFVFMFLLAILIYLLLYNREGTFKWKKNHVVFWIMVLMCWGYQICFLYNSFLLSPWIVYTMLSGLCLLVVTAPGYKKKITQRLAIMSSPILCFCIIESISNTNWKNLTFEVCLINIILLSICNIIIVNVLDYKKIGWYLLYLLSFIISTANYYVIQFKKFALMPSDILQFRTALAVADNYKYDLSSSIVVGFIIFLLAVIITYLYIPNSNFNLKRTIQKKCIAICAVFCLTIWINKIDFTQTYHVEKDDWDTSVTYSKSGFLLSFFSYAQTMHPKKPEGYSLKRVAEILEPYSESYVLAPEEKPVIIAIMNESFSDLRNLGDLKNTDGVMSFLDSYDGFLEKGNAYVSVRGGGTCNSEFEFLTGNSMKYFADTYPYTQYNFNGVPTLVSSLKSEGYNTIAMHPSGPTNYKRQTVYKQMGFDQFYSYNDYVNCEPFFYDRISDFDDYQKIIDVVDSYEEPLFIFNVTIQNHGYYDVNTLNPKNLLELITVDPTYNSFKDVQMYLSLIKASDNALKFLIQHFEKEERPVIICFFGDHQPGCLDAEFEKNFYEYNDQLSKLGNSQRFYTTPYFFWSNYDITTGKIDTSSDPISVNYLSSQLLEYAGLPMTSYERFLGEMKKNISASNRYGYMGNDGSWYQYNEKSPYTRWIEDYEILQYYYMFDN